MIVVFRQPFDLRFLTVYEICCIIIYFMVRYNIEQPFLVLKTYIYI